MAAWTLIPLPFLEDIKEIKKRRESKSFGMSSSDEEMVIGTPPELEEEAKLARSSLLPEKSTDKYLRTYNNFTAWRNKKNTNSYSENVLLAYFSELAKDKKPSTLWAMFSMLKSTIQLKHNINIKSYANLQAFLKRQSAGYKPKKSKILTDENITTFLNEAPDETFLLTKVALVMGVNGACRMIELTNLTIHDITCHNDTMLVKLNDTKTKIDRKFVIGQEFVPLVKKYMALRPPAITTDRFFINYKNGKCTSQVVGRHKMATIPTQIANILNLPDSDCYTGHCFRRSSATLLADSGANLTTLKRHGGWKSDAVAESYIEDSLQNKTDISNRINQTIKLRSSEHCHVENQSNLSEPQPSTSKQNLSQLCISQSILDPEPSTSRIKATPLPSQNQQFNITNTTSTSTAANQDNKQQCNLTVPGKTITLSITNCPNMSNVTINFN